MMKENAPSAVVEFSVDEVNELWEVMDAFVVPLAVRISELVFAY